MEKPSMFGENQGERGLEKWHELFKELLGEHYDEQKINGCIALQKSEGVINEMYENLKLDLENAESEEKRGEIIEHWLEENDVMKGVTH